MLHFARLIQFCGSPQILRTSRVAYIYIFTQRKPRKDLVRAAPCSALIVDVAKICVETQDWPIRDFANNLQNNKIFAIIFGGRENFLFSHNTTCVLRRQF